MTKIEKMVLLCMVYSRQQIWLSLLLYHFSKCFCCLLSRPRIRQSAASVHSSLCCALFASPTTFTMFRSLTYQSQVVDQEAVDCNHNITTIIRQLHTMSVQLIAVQCQAEIRSVTLLDEEKFYPTVLAWDEKEQSSIQQKNRFGGMNWRETKS